jgi:hypothetical protein
MAQENKLLARNNKTGLQLFSKRQLRFPSAACLRRIVGGPGTTQKVRMGPFAFWASPESAARHSSDAGSAMERRVARPCWLITC